MFFFSSADLEAVDILSTSLFLDEILISVSAVSNSEYVIRLIHETSFLLTDFSIKSLYMTIP